MDALRPSFMLLPDFTFLPDGDLQLGRVLPVMQKQKALPDPDRPLDVRVDVAVNRVSTHDHGKWSWRSSDQFSASGGIWADLSILTGVGTGIDGDRGSSMVLEVSSHKVTRETFKPTSTDIAAVLADPLVDSILNKISRPPAYIVTGRMIADGADISVQRRSRRAGGSHVSADVTSTGVPINAGVKGEVSVTHDKQLMESPKQPFILAYQVMRLRKRLKSVEQSIDRQFALFTDEIEMPGSLSIEGMEIDNLLPAGLEQQSAEPALQV